MQLGWWGRSDEALKADVDELRNKLQDYSDLLEKAHRKLERSASEAEDVQRFHQNELSDLRATTATRINALEEEMRELRLKLQHSEAKRQEIERRAAQQVLAMHGRLDAAQKLCVERLSQKQMLESELEALRKEHAEEVQERQRASADAQKAWTDLRRANAELANTTSELATSKATAAVLQREKAAAEKAYASEKAARDAIDDELQKCRSLIRELRARDDMRTSIRPRIAEQTAL